MPVFSQCGSFQNWSEFFISTNAGTKPTRNKDQFGGLSRIFCVNKEINVQEFLEVIGNHI